MLDAPPDQTDAPREFNFDGIVGPTHTFAGLGPGNLASQTHRDQPSNPRAAVLQGLDKMKLLHGLGVPQAVLPPTPRPDIPMLRRLGFAGTDEDVIRRAARDAPRWLAAAYSAASMWAANAATVAPSADTADGRVHLTPANLVSAAHRASETPFTTQTLRAIFSNADRFVVHDPLPGCADFADEGAANHTRFAPPGSPESPGVHLFVYGDDNRDNQKNDASATHRFTPRQKRAASEAVARLHQLNPARCVFAQQHPAAIDAGVFHHDVIGVGHESLLLTHEQAWVDQPARLRELHRACEHAGFALTVAQVPASRIPLGVAVASYLFNSQVVTAPDGRQHLIAPQQCERHHAIRPVIDAWIDAGHLAEAHFVPLDESMRNGGGPACLRLRLTLTAQEQTALHPGVRYSETLDAQLRAWARQHFRTRLNPRDLADPTLMHEARATSQALSDLLNLPALP